MMRSKSEWVCKLRRIKGKNLVIERVQVMLLWMGGMRARLWMLVDREM